ncbi:MAG: hypothetical protein ACLTBV_26075 [Enterocloster bolteae]
MKFVGEERNDFSHALFAQDCRDMMLENFRGKAARSTLEDVVIRQDEL